MLEPDNLLLTSSLEYTKSGNFPYYIRVIPFDAGQGVLGKNTLSIEYDWGDGTIDKIEYKINEQKNLENFIKLTNIPEEVQLGSPINYAADHIYYPNDKEDFEISKKYNIKITTKYFGTSAVTVQNVNLFLRKVDIIPQDNSLSFFRDISLLKTRMYGPNNTLFYAFESKTPNWILMSTVNWNLKSEKDENVTILPPIRPYKYLLPFEDKFTTLVPLNSSIESIRIVQRGNFGVNVNDRGGGGL